jgi:hypothetical protein
MNRKRSRLLRPRVLLPFLPGYPDEIDTLLLDLNDEGETSDLTREMVRNMNEVDRAIERNGGTKFWNLYDSMQRPDRKQRKELLKNGFDNSFIERMAAIQGECYKVDMRAMYPVKGKWRFFWGLPETEPRTGGIVLQVCLAVIHDLAAKGLLRRVRECATCGRWFYAYRPGRRYRFCSVACRDKNWRQTPQGRARRAKYMRDYRRREERANEAYQKTR